MKQVTVKAKAWGKDGRPKDYLLGIWVRNPESFEEAYFKTWKAIEKANGKVQALIIRQIEKQPLRILVG